MEKNKMKNIVVLKNLPSNLVEEAIVIFKSKKSAKEFEYIDKTKNKKKNNSNNNPNEYIIKEAESVILNCVSNNKKKEKNENSKGLSKKYKRLKIYSVIVSVLLILTFIV